MTRLEVLTTDEPTLWHQALVGCPQYDFYHLPQYHALESARGEGEARLFHFADGPYSICLPLLLRPLHELPYAPSVREEWWDATSVYGYVGPVCSHAEIPEAVVEEFQRALEETLRRLHVVDVFSRLHPLIEQHSLLGGLGECAMLSRTVSIDLTLPPETQRSQFHASTRTKINRLRRQGVICIHDKAGRYFENFLEIYDETMRRVRAAPMYFFGRTYFERLWRDLAPNVHLFVCLQNERPIAAGLFLDCRGIVQYHLAGTRTDALPMSPFRLLIDTVRLWATERGCRVLHLGGGLTGRPDDGLFHAKCGFSKRTHDFAVWRWVLMPEIYRRLCEETSLWNERHGLEAAAGYFPQYRSPIVAREPTACAAVQAVEVP